jgi:glycosyltransferase involved in cell wall biosynthesis
MRIAQVAPLHESVPPLYYGGTERVVSWLTERLVLLGHDVTLFASGDSVTKAHLFPPCKKALRLDPNCQDPIAQHVAMVEQVFSHADEFDIIHFHIDYLHFSLSRHTQVPCITTLHGRLDIPDLIPLYRQFRDMPLVSISDAQRKPLAWANWLGTAHHGMPTKILSLRKGGDYLAFLGRVSPEKGVGEAIEIAIASGRKLKIAAKVDRIDKEFFEAEIKPRLNHPLVEFLGEIGHAQKEEFLGNAAALLFPINWPEPFGLVMIEAMACGTPVLAHPRGSVPEIIEDGRNGFLVKNVDEALRALSKIDQIDRRECRRHFEDNFTDERMASKYLDIYQQLIGHGSSPIALEEGVLKWIEVESPSPSTT